MIDKPDLFDAEKYPRLRRQSKTSQGLCTLLSVSETSDGFLTGWARFEQYGETHEHSVFLGAASDFRPDPDPDPRPAGPWPSACLMCESAPCQHTKPRRLDAIAEEIVNDWGDKVNYAAKPYLLAMLELDDIKDAYYMDSGASLVRYFLGNATTWRGETARRVKAELKAMLKAL